MLDQGRVQFQMSLPCVLFTTRLLGMMTVNVTSNSPSGYAVSGSFGSTFKRAYQGAGR